MAGRAIEAGENCLKRLKLKRLGLNNETTYSYTHGHAAHKQAVTSISSGQGFSYDGNGNPSTTLQGKL